MSLAISCATQQNDSASVNLLCHSQIVLPRRTIRHRTVEDGVIRRVNVFVGLEVALLAVWSLWRSLFLQFGIPSRPISDPFRVKVRPGSLIIDWFHLFLD